ncbi:BppU family phage baseplate upper protein [Tetragenococcus halophilus]|uniref:BppU family phage baseplate upper protein n=1 Tax=Tetragenococcus halophilus TaxID=51669 RepID=UPI00077C4D2C|nr:BppU family phage baseplate upper protein [Tetragenococcus halophilus]
MLRKIAEIKVPKGAGPREAKTNPIFATYDRQGAAFAFFFSDSNIAGAAANLLFMVDGQKVFVDDGVTLGETNETHTFTYPLPDKLLNYTGKVDGYLYFDFEDGSHSDEIHFVFTIKKSQIDEEMEDAPDVYIKSFEDVKERVEQAGDSATKDIEKAKDDAESQIGEYVGEVESAKDTAVEDIDKALPEVEDKLDEVAGKISELDISDTNLLKGTSEEWEKFSLRAWADQESRIPIQDFGLEAGETITYSTEFDNSIDTNKTGLNVRIDFMKKRSDTQDIAGTLRGNFIGLGKKGISSGTEKIPEGTKFLRIFKVSRDANDGEKTAKYRKRKLQRGKYATDWKPNPSEIVTQDQYDKLANAIINLGGSI